MGNRFTPLDAKRNALRHFDAGVVDAELLFMFVERALIVTDDGAVIGTEGRSVARVVEEALASKPYLRVMEALADEGASDLSGAADLPSICEVERRIADAIDDAARFGPPSKIRIPAAWFAALFSSVTPRSWPPGRGPRLQRYYHELPIEPTTRLQSAAIVEVGERGK